MDLGNGEEKNQPRRTGAACIDSRNTAFAYVAPLQRTLPPYHPVAGSVPTETPQHRSPFPFPVSPRR